MVRSIASKVAWVGRTASMVFGLALVLALLLGVATVALGADGDLFKVGRTNLASAVSTLDKSGAGPALRLLVDSGAPLAVNSTTRVANLNADTVDGKSANLFWGSKTYDKEQTFDNSGVTDTFASVVCDGGDSAIGGGYDGLAATEGTVFRAVAKKQPVIAPISGRPFEEYAVAWKNATNTEGFDSNVKVVVHCADFPPANPNAS